MGFSKSLLITVFCLLLSFLGNVLTNQDYRSSYRGDSKSFNDDASSKDYVHNWRLQDDIPHNKPSTDQLLAPRTIKKTTNAIRNFMTENVPRIRTQIGINKKGQYAAIWVDIHGTAAFTYQPYHGNINTPVYNGYMYCAPPRWIGDRKITNENHLVARIERLHKPNTSDIHPEDILEQQVFGSKQDLGIFTSGQAVNRVMMYSYLHPCQNCARRLVNICNQLKTWATNNDFECHLVFSDHYSTRKNPMQTYTDAEVRRDIIQNRLQVYQIGEP